MTHIKYIESTAPDANAIECADCETEEPFGSYYYGAEAIREHNESFPLHTRITYLRMEAV